MDMLMIGYMVFRRNVTACLRLIRSTLSHQLLPEAAMILETAC